MKAYFDHEKLDVLARVPEPCGFNRVEHVSRVLVIESSRSRTCLVFTNSHTMTYVLKDCFGATPKPARETRALPIIPREEGDYSSSFEQEQEQGKE